VLREYKVVLVTSFAFFKWSEDVVPTVAFNFRRVRKGNVVLKIWDVAGASMIRQSLCPVTYEVSVDVQANQSSAQCGNVIAMELMP
jgi:hypothetical protein